MKDYKGWTPKERFASLKNTKTAVADGIIPSPTKCNRCGKETGRIDYHNHDYSDPIKYLEQLCQGCHTQLHRLENRALVLHCTGDETSKAPSLHLTAERTKADDGLNAWLELGMKLSVEKLPEHVVATPANVKPLHALRGLGIVFCNGFTSLYNCEGYPQKMGVGKNRQKFEIVIERIKHLERNGQSLRVKGLSLSDKLKSNYDNNT